MPLFHSSHNTFECRTCKKVSQLPDLPDKPGTYKVVCAFCNSEELFKVPSKTKHQPNTPKPPKESLGLIRIIIYFILGIFLGLVILVGGAGLYFYNELGKDVSEARKKVPFHLQKLNTLTPSYVIDRNGKLISELYQKKSSSLKFNEYPPVIIKTLLQIEDQNFYYHPGIDIKAVIRAFVRNYSQKKYSQGGSTLTQQLARILLDDREKTIKRKYKEAVLALAIEKELSKEKILEYYLNHVYLGHGAIGFQEAAKFYFGRDVQDLHFLEVLLLCSLPANPTKFSPLKSPDESRQRFSALLRTLQYRGKVRPIQEKDIDALFYQFYVRSPNETVYGQRVDHSGYITEHVREVLSSVDPESSLYNVGGYSIQTTVSLDIQIYSEKFMKKYLQYLQDNDFLKQNYIPLKNKDKIDSIFQETYEDVSILIDPMFGHSFTKKNFGNTIQGTFLLLEPTTNQILAMVGGDEFRNNNQLNRTFQMIRQPGSTIKPLLYGIAVDKGLYTPSSILQDTPLFYKMGNKTWNPENLGESYEGEITLRRALMKSKNSVAVQVAENIGFRDLQLYYSNFFFPDPDESKKRFRQDLTIALGSLEVSPLELTSVYSNFINKGIVHRPYSISIVKDKYGKQILDSNSIDEFNLRWPVNRRVFQEDTAEIMLSMLKDSGKYSGIPKSPYKSEIAAKTGTTNDSKDLWVIGAKKNFTASIWLGFDNSIYSLGKNAIASNIAGPMWGDLIYQLIQKQILIDSDYPQPTQTKMIQICKISHLVATENCKQTEYEIFPKTKIPNQFCMEHRPEIRENSNSDYNPF